MIIFQKLNIMDELQTYLNNRLQIFKQSCDNWLADYKRALQSQHNQFLLSKIEEAEKNIEEGKLKFIEIFKNSMENLQKRREKAHPMMKKSLDMWEEGLKKQLDSNLQFVENNWKSYIENCKTQMK
jgi:hypothetical protein